MSHAVEQIPLHFRASELRLLGGDADVAHQRQLEAAGQAVAVDGRDDRLPDVDALGDAAEVRALVSAPAVALG